MTARQMTDEDRKRLGSKNRIPTVDGTGTPVPVRLGGPDIHTVKRQSRRKMRTQGSRIVQIGHSYSNEPLRRLVSQRLTALEGEAVGWYLFGGQLPKLQVWWKTATELEAQRMGWEANVIYLRIQVAILGEADLLSCAAIGHLLTPTLGGRVQSKQSVQSYLDSAARKAGAINRHHLRGIVLRGLSERADRALGPRGLQPEDRLRGAVLNLAAAR